MLRIHLLQNTIQVMNRQSIHLIQKSRPLHLEIQNPLNHQTGHHLSILGRLELLVLQVDKLLEHLVQGSPKVLLPLAVLALHPVDSHLKDLLVASKQLADPIKLPLHLPFSNLYKFFQSKIILRERNLLRMSSL